MERVKTFEESKLKQSIWIGPMYNERWLNNKKPTINNNRNNAKVSLLSKEKKARFFFGLLFTFYLIFQTLCPRISIFALHFTMMDSLTLPSFFLSRWKFYSVCNKKVVIWTKKITTRQHWNMGSHTSHVKQRNTNEKKESNKCKHLGMLNRSTAENRNPI